MGLGVGVGDNGCTLHKSFQGGSSVAVLLCSYAVTSYDMKVVTKE